MKTRRHHNNTGRRQIVRGKCAEQVRRIARKLGLRFTVNSAAPGLTAGFIVANAALETPRDGWFEIAPFGDWPAPGRGYVQHFHREQGEAIVRTWNSIAGKAARWIKNIRHRLSPSFDMPIFEWHTDTDPTNYAALPTLGAISDLRVTENGLEGHVTWNAAGMGARARGPLYPSGVFWHEAPDAQGRVYPALIESVGLVPTPNIPTAAWTRNAALESQSEKQNQTTNNEAMTPEQIAALRKSLGLPETADAAACIIAAQTANANAQLLTTANSAGDKAAADLVTANTALTEANTKVTSLTTENGALKTERDGLTKAATDLATANAGRVKPLLDHMEKFGVITAAERAAFEPKFTANFGGTLDELLAKKPSLNVQPLQLNAGPQAVATENARRDAVQSLVRKCMTENSLSYDEAFDRVQADPANAALFKAETAKS